MFRYTELAAEVKQEEVKWRLKERVCLKVALNRQGDDFVDTLNFTEEDRA